MHHVLHVAATGEGNGYYADYHGDWRSSAAPWPRASPFRASRRPIAAQARGEPSAHLPPTAFVTFLQNHDQIGNRALGDRIAALRPPEAVRAVAAIYLLLPQVPMLFMGEEWGDGAALPLLLRLRPRARRAVREGRREEFAASPSSSDPATRERIPDPTAAGTLELPAALGRARHEPMPSWLDWYRARSRPPCASYPAVAGRYRRGGRYEEIGEGAVACAGRWRGAH